MTAAALLPLVPFAAALVGFLLPFRARRVAAWLAVGAAAVALGSAVVLLWSVPVAASHRMVDFGGLPVTLTLRVDEAASLVAIAVGVVALAVQVYSVAYLQDDDRYPPYAAQVSLFTAAMMLVVVSGDLVMLLVGWEVMGICSYLLIGHDRRLPEAPAAAVKAFVVTRVGDVGFLLGIAFLGVRARSFRLDDVLYAVETGALGSMEITVVCLLLLAGVAGKSAQFPLHTWLPDAMAGPTPISALIHAATMVAAGIYVVTRLYPLYLASPTALAVLGVMAAVTLLLGAFAATAQDDIKRVLAWSTVSQLGYMAGALAVTAAPAALFHLLTHAAFKALLFLVAGCVIHAVGTNLMSSMGGLRRGMPIAFWTMTVGLCALVGLPPFAGFWSKDGILAAASAARDGGLTVAGWVAWLVWLAGLIGVAVTAWYATRLWLRTFFGASRSSARAHDAPGLMSWPVILLAIPSLLLGLAGLSGGFSAALGATGELVHVDGEVLLPSGLAALGVLVAWALWRRDTAADPARVLGPVRPVFANAFYVDNVQDALVVRPVTAAARLTRRADESIVDGAVEGTGRGALGLGGLLATAHRAGLPRAATAVLAGALLIGLAAVAVSGVIGP